jgi:hypothetical protein
MFELLAFYYSSKIFADGFVPPSHMAKCVFRVKSKRFDQIEGSPQTNTATIVTSIIDNTSGLFV